MICRDCGGLLHVGLRHECSGGDAAELARRLRRAQRARATYATTGLGDPIQSPPWHDEWPRDTWDNPRTQSMVDAGIAWPAPQKPIRVMATVGRATACQVANCQLHTP